MVSGYQVPVPATPEQPPETPSAAPSLKPLRPPTINCPDGPGKEHEWTQTEEIGILICAHCNTRAEYFQVLLLYQKCRLIERRDLNDMQKRLEYELKRGNLKVLDKGDFKTDMERQLFEDNEYFKKRLDEEMALVTNMKKDISAADRRVAEMVQTVKNLEASNASFRETRDFWRAKAKDMRADLLKLAERVKDDML